MISRQAYDLTSGEQTATFRKTAKGLVLEFAPDNNGNMNGSYQVFVNGNKGGLPFIVMNAGDMYAMPIEALDGMQVTIVPINNAVGTAIVSITNHPINPFIGTRA